MMADDNVKFQKDSFPSSVPPDTNFRTTVSTEVGNTDAEIQHVFIDDKSGNAPTFGLPSDAATETKQDDIITELQTVYIDDSMLTIAAGERVLLSRLAGTVNKFGENAASLKDVAEVVWNDGGLTYPFPAAATITDIKQVADQEAMRGQNIEVQGLDVNWDLVVQTKALDASDTSTKATLGTALRRIFRMKVLANVVTDQDVVAMDTGAGVAVFARADAGDNQTLMAIYTVPNGMTAYMTNYYADYTRTVALDPTSVEYKLWSADRDNSYEFQLKHEKGTPQGAPGFQHNFRPYYKFTEKTDIKITAKPDAKDGHIHAGFDLILVTN